MEMKPAISCTILRHTKIGTENNGDNKKTHQSVVSQRESVKNDKPTISMSLSHCIHQTLNSKASTRFHSGGLQQSLTLILKRAFSSQLAAKLRNRLLVL